MNVPTIQLTPVNVAKAVKALRYALKMGYETATEAELEACAAGCRNDAQLTQAFLWLLPHLETQIRAKVKEDGDRFRDRIYSGRNYR